MASHVLGVGYSYAEYGITAAEWQNYGIEFDYVDDIGQAAAMLSFKEYMHKTDHLRRTEGCAQPSA